jgi:glycosyltransferase involved in cell wall biosynthesis
MFTTSLPERGRKPGGVDVLIDRLATVLEERGHDVTIWSYSPRPETSPYGHVQLTPRSFTFNKLARTAVVPMALNTVNFQGVDVLHLHGDDWFFFRRRVPTVRTLYGSALYEARFAESVKRRVSQMVQVPLEVLSSRLATACYGMIPGDAPVHRTVGSLPGGAQLPPRSTGRSEHPSILFVGTWGGRKRGRLLFDAFTRHVKPVMPDAELWMVADHAEPAEGVRLFKAPSAETVMELYASAWVFCLPSLYEGFGLPYVEALASGTPVVTTSNPGADFILERGRLGVVVDDTGLGPELARLLSDGPRRKALASAGLPRARDFEWETVAGLHERAYADAINRWQSRHNAR